MKYYLLIFLLIVQFLSAGEISLAWDNSPDIKLNIVYYGTSSLYYTSHIFTRTNNQITISNLDSNIKYYFSVTSVNTNFIESTLSNEVSEYPYSLTAKCEISSNRHMNISFFGLSNHVYIIEASTNLLTWSNIYTTASQSNRQLINFTDTDMVKYQCRFYRIKDN